MTDSVLREIILTGGAFLLLFLYHLHLRYTNRRHPAATSFARNAQTRVVWVKEVMQNGRDILAAQTLRNWTMAASLLASTAILIALAILNVALTGEKSTAISHILNFFGTKSEGMRLIKFLVLSFDFFFAFFNFTLAIRYYNHVGFMINVPPGTESLVDHKYVAETLNHGAAHYTLGMRGFYLAIPLTLWLLGPTWLLAGNVILVIILYRVDRTG